MGKEEKYRNMLEDVVNELDLSALAIEKHGPLGTPPAELVRLVLDEKDKIIRNLKAGLKMIIVSDTKLKRRAVIKQELILFLNSIREYEHENGDSICDDERTSEEFVDIYLGEIRFRESRRYKMVL